MYFGVFLHGIQQLIQCLVHAALRDQGKSLFRLIDISMVDRIDHRFRPCCALRQLRRRDRVEHFGFSSATFLNAIGISI